MKAMPWTNGKQIKNCERQAVNQWETHSKLWVLCCEPMGNKLKTVSVRLWTNGDYFKIVSVRPLTNGKQIQNCQCLAINQWETISKLWAPGPEPMGNKFKIVSVRPWTNGKPSQHCECQAANQRKVNSKLWALGREQIGTKFKIVSSKGRARIWNSTWCKSMPKGRVVNFWCNFEQLLGTKG